MAVRGTGLKHAAKLTEEAVISVTIIIVQGGMGVTWAKYLERHQTPKCRLY